jgi:hypothetical protein
MKTVCDKRCTQLGYIFVSSVLPVRLHDMCFFHIHFYAKLSLFTKLGMDVILLEANTLPRFLISYRTYEIVTTNDI